MLEEELAVMTVLFSCRGKIDVVSRDHLHTARAFVPFIVADGVNAAARAYSRSIVRAIEGHVAFAAPLFPTLQTKNLFPKPSPPCPFYPKWIMGPVPFIHFCRSHVFVRRQKSFDGIADELRVRPAASGAQMNLVIPKVLRFMPLAGRVPVYEVDVVVLLGERTGVFIRGFLI